MDERETQEILLQLHQSDFTDGDKKGWKVIDEEEPACTWEGILCDPIDNTLTSITIPGQTNNNPTQTGIIPSELSKFSNLINIDFHQHSKIHGTIPSEVTRGLLNLEIFNVANNYLEGPLPKFASDKLMILNVSHNELNGPIYDTIFTSNPMIQIIDLSRNDFVFTIPSPIVEEEEEEQSTTKTTAKNLQVLDVSHCNLGGQVPWEEMWHTLTNLRELNLSYNNFVGTIPQILFNTVRSKSAKNEEDQQVDTSSNIMLLDELHIQHNMFSGTLPNDFLNLKSLKKFFIHGNKFTGSIPEELCERRLNGRSDSQCSSIACPTDTYSDNIDGEGISPCVQCHTDRVNPYLGSTLGEDSCLDVDDESAILGSLFRSTFGFEWTNSDGWTDHDVSVCVRNGITCNKEGYVTHIDLNNNNLKGTIPPTVGFLKQLVSINLSDNHLTGMVPSELQFASATLKSINVGGNELTGFVPPMLCSTELGKAINGEGSNKCDKIACPVGTWDPDGYNVGPDGCMPCLTKEGGYPVSPFVGSKSCDPTAVASTSGFFGMSATGGGSSGNDDDSSGWGKWFGVSIGVFFVALIIGTLVKRRRSRARSASGSNDGSDEVHDPYADKDAFFDDIEHEYDQSSHWRKGFDSSHHHHIDDDGVPVPKSAAAAAGAGRAGHHEMMETIPSPRREQRNRKLRRASDGGGTNDGNNNDIDYDYDDQQDHLHHDDNLSTVQEGEQVGGGGSRRASNDNGGNDNANTINDPTNRRGSAGHTTVIDDDGDDLLMLDVAQIKINKKF